MKTLLFGTAGIPISTLGKKDTYAGISHIKTLGLGCMELPFVRNVFITPEKTNDVKAVATKENVVLTSHASYFLNLNAKEKAKYYASLSRIKKAAEITALCGGYSVCFHAGYYLGDDAKKVYTKIKSAFMSLTKELRDGGHSIWLRPETTGKPTQFGDIHEAIKLSSEVEGVLPCIDFSHLHARTNGKYNTYEEIVEVLAMYEKTLGKENLKEMHIHLAGIAYGEKGEKHHLKLKESDLNYPEILRAWKDFKLAGVVVCESPNLEDDAQLLQKTYEKL